MDLSFLDYSRDMRAGYGAHHLLYLLSVLSHDPLGRPRLVKELGIGEAPVRTMLRRLNNDGFVEPTTLGQRLTPKARELMAEIGSHVKGPVSFEGSGVTIGRFDVALALSGCVKKPDAVRVRDEALKAGAEGATTLVFKDGKISIEGFSGDAPKRVRDELAGKFSLKNRDTVVLGTSHSLMKARDGAFAGALFVLKNYL